ncbi:MAG: DNA repair protein RecN [Frankiaceae bacterium]
MRIQGLGVIDDAVLELGPGLTVVTGETGAGKTMVVQGLALLLGRRADAGLVRPGAARAVVEGRLRVDPAGRVAARAREAGAELDGDEMIVNRSVSAEGRGRAHLGGRAVPVAVLAELADWLVAVHGQSDQHRLLRAAAQRDALDAYAGAAVREQLDAYAATYARHADAVATLAELRARARERAQEADVLRFGLAEIAAVAPAAGEDRALVAELDRLSHADALRRAAGEAQVALTGDADALDEVDALGLLTAARRALDPVQGHDEALAALAGRVAEAGFLLADVAADLASYAAGVDADPVRLATANERLAALTALTRKYGGDASEVLAWADRAQHRLAELDGADDRITALESERAALAERLADLAGRLSLARTAAADRFAAAVGSELRGLAMPQAALAVELAQRDDPDGLPVGDRILAYGPAGVDEVALLLRPHAGAAARPLARGASGGELSRVMLAVEVVLAGADPVPTFVFDEVDAGVGGRAAVEIGRRLARLARSAQVIVVTHLPQVAAFADRHLMVEKSGDGTVTASGVVALDDAGRVRELSRMLAGLESSALAQGHAEELLATAAAAKGGERPSS